MKHLQFFLLAMLLCLSAFAQWDITEHQLNGLKIISMATDPSGYFMLVKTEREEQVDYVIKTYSEPALIHYDADWNEQWRLTFRETNLPELQHVQLVGDQVILSGTHYLPDDDHCQLWVVCIDHSGQILWDRKYGYPGYHSVEGNQVYQAPDGSLIVAGMAYRIASSYGSPVITKLQPDGTMLWQKLYGTQYVLPSFSDGVLSPDGMLTMAGHVYPDQTWFRSERSKGWVVKINCAGNGEVIWEKQFELGPHTQFRDVTLLASGDFGIVGGAGPTVNVTSNLIMVLRQTGEMVWKDLWKNNATSSLTAIVQHPVDGRYYSSGRTFLAPSTAESLQTEMVILDADFRRLDEVIVDAHAISEPQCGPRGGVLTHGAEKMLTFR